VDLRTPSRRRPELPTVSRSTPTLAAIAGPARSLAERGPWTDADRPSPAARVLTD